VVLKIGYHLVYANKNKLFIFYLLPRIALKCRSVRKIVIVDKSKQNQFVRSLDLSLGFCLKQFRIIKNITYYSVKLELANRFITPSIIDNKLRNVPENFPAQCFWEISSGLKPPTCLWHPYLD
jgi:hypothetical protein